MTQLRHSPRRTVVVLDAGFRPIKEGVLAVENGETHFRDIDIEISEVGPDGTTSKRLPATEFTSERRQPIPNQSLSDAFIAADLPLA